MMNENEGNLAYIKSHPLFPFRDYSSDELQYMYIELFWVYLFKNVIGNNSDGAWHAFHPPDLEREGNPIFSVVNYSLQRAVRVIHRQIGSEARRYSDGGDYFPFQPFMSVIPGELLDSGLTIDELCFGADVSEEGEQAARRFIKKFCVDLVSVNEMEAMIQHYEESVGMPYPTLEDE